MISARKAAPEIVKRAGRTAYVLAGTATAGLRLQPDFIMIGAQRSGTTSLFRALLAHPQVIRPTFHKGINYFDLNYFRSVRWYRRTRAWLRMGEFREGARTGGLQARGRDRPDAGRSPL